MPTCSRATSTATNGTATATKRPRSHHATRSTTSPTCRTSCAAHRSMSTARTIKQSTPADPAEVLRARIEARTLLYSLGEIELHEVVPDDLSRLIEDEYSGLTYTFAAACRAADAEAAAAEQRRIVKPNPFRL